MLFSILSLFLQSIYQNNGSAWNLKTTKKIQNILSFQIRTFGLVTEGSV